MLQKFRYILFESRYIIFDKNFYRGRIITKRFFEFQRQSWDGRQAPLVDLTAHFCFFYSPYKDKDRLLKLCHLLAIADFKSLVSSNDFMRWKWLLRRIISFILNSLEMYDHLQPTYQIIDQTLDLISILETPQADMMLEIFTSNHFFLHAGKFMTQHVITA